jgi:membrane dipeptidase
VSVTDSAELHVSSVVADAHNDLLMSVSARPPDRWGRFFREHWLPQLREGGVDVQVLPVWVDSANAPETGLRTMLRMIECAHRLAEENADVARLCLTGPELFSAVEDGLLALVLALEGCGPLERDVELLSTLARLGVRIASLAHFGRTAMADGSGEDAAGGRLTRAGVEAVQVMHEVGMLLDLSHLGIRGVEHALELTQRPVIATHSNARALCDHHRNLPDSHLRGIAAVGGVVCVNFFAGYVHPTDHTVGRLLDQVEHIASVAGIDAVGLGPDFIREVEQELRPPWQDDHVEEGVDSRWCIPGLEGPRGLPLVTTGLLERGLLPTDVQKILGGNVLRLFDAELGRPAAAP